MEKELGLKSRKNVIAHELSHAIVMNKMGVKMSEISFVPSGTSLARVESAEGIPLDSLAPIAIASLALTNVLSGYVAYGTGSDEMQVKIAAENGGVSEVSAHKKAIEILSAFGINTILNMIKLISDENHTKIGPNAFARLEERAKNMTTENINPNNESQKNNLQVSPSTIFVS